MTIQDTVADAQAETVGNIALEWGRAGTEGGYQEVAFLLGRAAKLMRTIAKEGAGITFERTPRGTEGDEVSEFRKG